MIKNLPEWIIITKMIPKNDYHDAIKLLSVLNRQQAARVVGFSRQASYQIKPAYLDREDAWFLVKNSTKYLKVIKHFYAQLIKK